MKVRSMGSIMKSGFHVKVSTEQHLLKTTMMAVSGEVGLLKEPWK